MNKEIWKDIPNYEGLYQVSNFGRIKSLIKWNISKKKFEKNQLIRKTRINFKGYETIKLSKNGFDKNFQIHRLVAQAFIPNPNNLPQINHKDENKLNNNVNNLEWCTNKYNSNYGTRNTKISNTMSKKIIIFDKINNKSMTFNSIKEASIILKLNQNSIRCVASGHRNSLFGLYINYI